MLIDSAPRRVSGCGCPRSFDPVENLPEHAEHLGFIFGQQDSVVPQRLWRELADVACKRGATVIERPDFDHPFLEWGGSARDARRLIIRDFYSDQIAQQTDG